MAVPGVCIGARHEGRPRCCWWPTAAARAGRLALDSVVAHVGGAGAPPAARATRRSRRAALRGASAVGAAVASRARGALIIGDPALQAPAARSSLHVRSGRAVARADRAAVRLRRLGLARRRRSTPNVARMLQRSHRRTAWRGSTRSPPTPAVTACPSARAATSTTSSGSVSMTSWSRAPTSTSARAADAGTLAAETAKLRLVDGTRRLRRRRRAVCSAACRRRAPLGRRVTAMLERGRADRARRRRRPPPPRAQPRRRRHLHRRPQHQLHQRLRHRLPLLRVLPQPRRHDEGYVLSREDAGREDPRDRRRRRRADPLAGRAQPRAAAQLVRGSLPPHEGDLSDQAARALARGDPLPRRLESLPLETVLQRLVAAGLDSVPGGGAEILVDRVRARIAKLKCTGARVAGGDARRPPPRPALVGDDDVRRAARRCPSASSTS